jgi:hypothetical protein
MKPGTQFGRGGKRYEAVVGNCKDCAAAFDGELCKVMPACAGLSFKEIPITAIAKEIIAPVLGRKDDSSKLDVTLFFDDLPHAIEAVTEVLQWAITKKQPVPYERGSWQGVTDFQRRYRAAMLRHTIDMAKEAKVNGLPQEQATDAETNLRQLAHIATDAMFMLEMAVRKDKGLTA